MARNGSGTYVLPPSNPVSSGTVIESDWANDTMADLAAALTQSIAYDGQTVPIANLPMGGFHHTNCSDATARNQYATLGMVQDGKHTRVQIVSGVDNLVGTLVGGATGYVAGSLITFFAPANNTGPMTMNYNGIGARSIVSSNGLPLVAGNVKTNDFLMAIYDGTQFKLISSVTSTVAVNLLQLATTGEERPGGVSFPAMTIATGTSINIPAGTAWVVPPNSNDPGDAIKVTWNAQALTLTLMATSFTTTIAVNEFGQIVQFAGKAAGATLRGNAVLGVVEHLTGVANKVITKPLIFADDGYRMTDIGTLLSNTIITGGLVIPNSISPMQMDIAAGTIFMPGGDANTINSPNVYAIPQQANIPFRTLAGQSLVSGGTTANAQVQQYDPNGSGVVTTLPNNGDTVIHRLYYLYGTYIWAYGQKIYTSVENALSMINWDRSQYVKSLYLSDATLVAEIVAIKNTTSLANIAQAAIVCPGAINFSIGGPGGITDAPIDGTPYGRQDAAWTKVLRQTSPTVLTNMNINGPTPSFSQVQNPAGAGTVGLFHNSGTFGWFSIETVNPDDKTYFRSRNPANSALRFTTTYDLAAGSWGFPAAITVATAITAGGAINAATVASTGNMSVGGNLGVAGQVDVTSPIINAGGQAVIRGPTVSVVDEIPRWADVGGRLMKVGLKYQTSQLDTTAGRLLVNGAYGLGASIGLTAGTNLNTIVNSGFYRILGAPVNGPGTPASVTDGLLLVTRGLDTISQQATDYVSGQTWVRAGSPPDVGGVGTWGAWGVCLRAQLGYQTGVSDLNNLIVPGFYQVQPGILNAPESTFAAVIVELLDPNTVMQTYKSTGLVPKDFRRNKSGGGWGAWFQVYSDSTIAPTMNSDYFDAESLRFRRIGKQVSFTGKIGRNTPMLPSDVCCFIPNTYAPNTNVFWTGLVSYNNLGSQVCGVQTIIANAWIQLGFVITIGGAPAGVCNLGIGQSWFVP